MSKKRFLAGIMSLLLIITSVFTGNVVTVRAAESAIDSSSYTDRRYVVSGDDAPESFESVLIPDGCCFCVEKAITVNGAITVNPGGRLEVVGDGNITCGSLSVGESAEGKDPSLYFDGTSNVPKIGDTALDLYELTDDGFSKIQDVQWSEFIYDYTVSKWVLFNPYDAFGPTEEYPTIVEVELRGYTRSGEESFPISFESVDKNNTFDGWDRMKARVSGDSLTISWDADAEVKPLQICVEGAGENNDWLIADVGEDQNSYTISLLEENKDHYLVQVKYQLDQDSDGGRITYGKDGILEFNIENYDKGDVSFQIGEGPRYRVGGTEDVPEEKMQDALKDTTLEAGNTMKVWAGAYGGKIVGNFDIRIDGESVFSTDDERTSARTEAKSTEGYTFTVPTGYESTKRIELAIEFRDEASGGSNGVNCYGKDDKLAFNIANSDKGNVFFQVGEVKYRVGGDDQYSESAIRDTLKTKEFAATEKITIWAENGDGVNLSHFDIQIAGKSAFGDDTTKDEAKNAAQSGSGYEFKVPEGYTSEQLIEFQIEFLTEESGGGDNDVTYDADTTISSDLTMNDVTVNAGTLTIDGCSLRIDHALVVNDSASIVGTSASSKLVLAGDAFSNGIELYYGDEKISDDKNNYYSNNGDAPIEFIWNMTLNRWVTEQQPAEGGGDA
ncbi:MAG: fibronectin type III domain-containing protein, partial [Agathobacter sp.]|nr:fibronectin type III domain-containing protein [Agathobacter sp.]